MALLNKLVEFVDGIRAQVRWGASTLERASDAHLDTLSWHALVQLRDASIALQQAAEDEMLGRLAEKDAADLAALREASIELYRVAIARLQGPKLAPGEPDPRD